MGGANSVRYEVFRGAAFRPPGFGGTEYSVGESNAGENQRFWSVEGVEQRPRIL